MKRLLCGFLLLAAVAARAEERVVLVAGDPAARLELEPFRVFRAGARVSVHGAGGVRTENPPATEYFRGSVRGEPGSLAVLAVEPDGRRRGLVVARGRSFELAGEAGRLIVLPDAPASRPTGDRCGADSAAALPSGAANADAAPPAARGAGLQAAIVAVETDWELFDRLGSTAAVASHVGDLFATVAAVYRRDLGTDVVLGELIVWETADDPFTVEAGFLDALYELGDHWHADHPSVERSTVHFVSGKAGILGGIAYHGVLCTPDSPVGGGHWGGGYSLTGAHGVFGAFRDAYLTAHELGHNFRSHHSHCYNDLPELGDPEIDRCYSGDVRNDGNPCYSGAVSVPGDGGSIMSYCHLLSGGYSNVVLSLGGPGVHGERSERVVDRMRAHVESVGCLVVADPTLFVDGFETGDFDRWSASFP